MKNFTLFIALLFSVNLLIAQSEISICHTPATESFAMFASNQKFNSEHPVPEPYVHRSKITTATWVL